MDPEPLGMFQLETWESLWFAIPVGMDDADELAEIIQAGGGTVVDETRATQAQYLLLSASLHDFKELATQATEKGALAIDARWIYASKLAKKLLSWHKYQIGKPEETKSIDSNMRDLRELAIHLARYNPVGPARDDIYLKLTRKLPHLTSRQLKHLHETHRESVDACVVDLANQMAAIAPPADYDFFRGMGRASNKSRLRSQSPHPPNSAYPLSPSSDSGFPRHPFPLYNTSAATVPAASSLHHRRTTSASRQADIGDQQGDDLDGGDGIFPIRTGRRGQDKGKQRLYTTDFVYRPTSTTKSTLDNSQNRPVTPQSPEDTPTAGGPATPAFTAPKEEDIEPVLIPATDMGVENFASVPLKVDENEMPRRRSDRGRNVGRGRWVWADVETGTDWIWVADLGEGICVSDSQYL